MGASTEGEKETAELESARWDERGDGCRLASTRRPAGDLGDLGDEAEGGGVGVTPTGSLLQRVLDEQETYLTRFQPLHEPQLFPGSVRQ